MKRYGSIFAFVLVISLAQSLAAQSGEVPALGFSYEVIDGSQKVVGLVVDGRADRAGINLGDHIHLAGDERATSFNWLLATTPGWNTMTVRLSNRYGNKFRTVRLTEFDGPPKRRQWMNSAQLGFAVESTDGGPVKVATGQHKHATIEAVNDSDVSDMASFQQQLSNMTGEFNLTLHPQRTDRRKTIKAGQAGQRVALLTSPVMIEPSLGVGMENREDYIYINAVPSGSRGAGLGMLPGDTIHKINDVSLEEDPSMLGKLGSFSSLEIHRSTDDRDQILSIEPNSISVVKVQRMVKITNHLDRDWELYKNDGTRGATEGDELVMTVPANTTRFQPSWDGVKWTARELGHGAVLGEVTVSDSMDSLHVPVNSSIFAMPDLGLGGKKLDGRGFVISGVRPGGLADSMGLVPGDVIKSIDGKDINTISDLASATNKAFMLIVAPFGSDNVSVDMRCNPKRAVVGIRNHHPRNVNVWQWNQVNNPVFLKTVEAGEYLDVEVPIDDGNRISIIPFDDNQPRINITIGENAISDVRFPN